MFDLCHKSEKNVQQLKSYLRIKAAGGVQDPSRSEMTMLKKKSCNGLLWALIVQSQSVGVITFVRRFAKSKMGILSRTL